MTTGEHKMADLLLPHGGGEEGRWGVVNGCGRRGLRGG